MNFSCSGIGCVTQAKVRALVVGRDVTASAHHVLALTNAICRQIYSCANSITRTPGPSHKLQFHPMVMIGIDVLQQYWGSIHGVDDHIDLAVVEEIAERRSASPGHHRETGPFYRRYIVKLALVVVVEQQRALGVGRSPIMIVNLGIDVAVHHHRILPSVVVVVKKGSSPTHKRHSDLSDSRVSSRFGKAGVAIVSIQSLVVI